MANSAERGVYSASTLASKTTFKRAEACAPVTAIVLFERLEIRTPDWRGMGSHQPGDKTQTDSVTKSTSTGVRARPLPPGAAKELCAARPAPFREPLPWPCGIRATPPVWF